MKKVVARAVVLLVVCGMYFGYPRGQSQSAEAQQSGSLVLRGGRLIDGTGRPPLENSVVVMEGGKIVAVGREGEVVSPSGAQVINVEGKTIIPGLVDAHIHLGEFHPAVYLYWGVTTVGDIGNPTAWVLAVRNAIEKGAVVGPTILIASPMNMTKTRSHELPWGSERWGFGTPANAGVRVGLEAYARGMPNRRLVKDASIIEEVVLEAKHLNLDALTLYEVFPAETMKLAGQIGHRHGLPVFSEFDLHSDIAHRRPFEEIMNTGMDALVEMFGLEFSAMTPADRERAKREKIIDPAFLMQSSLIPEIAQKLVDSKMALVPSLVHFIPSASRHREEFDRVNTTFLNGPIGSEVPDREEQLEANKPYKTAKEKEEMELGWKMQAEFLKVFAEKGGKIAAGTGAPQGGSPGVSLHNELRMYAEAGVPPMKVIQAGTLWAQEIWGKGKEAGSIEAGKRADVVVLNRNPLEDMSAIRDIHTVIKNGKVVDREGLANWKDPFPEPQLASDSPIVDEISPPLLPVNQGEAVPEVIVRGGNFTPECRVLLNGQLVATKFHDSERLGITIEPSLLKQPGTYLISVVKPGSGEGISNPWYFFVTH